MQSSSSRQKSKRVIPTNSSTASPGGGQNISTKSKQKLIQAHKRRCDDVKVWNNIPDCVSGAIATLVDCSFELDLNMSRYQANTDKRLHLFNESIAHMKHLMAQFEDRITQSLDSYCLEFEQRIDNFTATFSPRVLTLEEQVHRMQHEIVKHW